MMTSPHKSHSRRDLIDIIKHFKLDIEDVDDYNKKQITEKLYNKIYSLDEIYPDENFYCITNLRDLKEYLIKPNQKKILSIKDKNEIMTTAKLIIQYCKIGYCVEISYFDTMDDIYIDARRISQFGDIPSVRRMCQLLNKNPHSNEMVLPVVSKKILKELEIKQITSQKCFHSLYVSRKNVVLSFD